MKLRLALAAALAITALTAGAQAEQPWLQNRKMGEGIGIRTGNLELHPGIAAEFGYDSNYFRRADDGTPGEEAIDFLRLRVTPHLTLSTLNGPRLEIARGDMPAVMFNAGVYAIYNEFIATDSANSDVANDQRHVAAGADFRLDVMRNMPVGIDVSGNYQRTVEPSNSEGGGEGAAENDYNRSSLRLGAGATWRPGGGMFEWRLGYEVGMTFFEAQSFEYLNNARHTVETSGRWKFLPRTAVMFDSRYQLTRFSNATSQNDGEAVRSRLGIRGLITNRFAAMAMAGWASSFYRANGAFIARNYDNVVLQGEVTWFILQPAADQVDVSSVSLGYVRDFSSSYLGSFVQRDRGYVGSTYLIGGAIVLNLTGGLTHVSYPDASTGPAVVNPTFSENRVDARLFAEYRLIDTVGINTTLQYDQNIADRPIVVNAMGATENTEYSRYQAYLGVRWFM